MILKIHGVKKGMILIKCEIWQDGYIEKRLENYDISCRKGISTNEYKFKCFRFPFLKSVILFSFP